MSSSDSDYNQTELNNLFETDEDFATNNDENAEDTA